MHLSASEQATLNFYEWECLGRGYYHFDTQIEIEPPYRPFKHKVNEYSRIDDGKVPNILQRLLSLVDEREHEPEYKSVEFIPNRYKASTERVGFSFSLMTGEEVSSIVTIEFLNMLAFSNTPISFEIVGTKDEIVFQFVSSVHDIQRIRSNLKAFFPETILIDTYKDDLGFDFENEVAICDFGLSDECIRPVHTPKNYHIDPLLSTIALLDHLENVDRVVMQVIFKGVSAPWAKDMLNAVSDGQGGSFFSDVPEMVGCAQEKVALPLFSCVVRIAAQSTSQNRSRNLTTELSRNISIVSSSEHNKLIPLSNEGYEYDDHLYNLLHRTSNRLGMFLNSGELATFVHYPNKTVISSKLGLHEAKTKSAPEIVSDQKYTIGINWHNQIDTRVSLDDEMRLRHTHIIGATGAGKSTLIANMIFEDIRAGNGCALFDPHGDIVDDILKRIPESRKHDVIVIDPSDTEYPIGFNLLGAKTEIEKIVLSSDLVSAFKQRTTSWGDNIQAVLSNAINTFLESEKGGTLIELKRFLLEEKFRNDFLISVEDTSLHYYWTYEYPLVKKGIAPLLTRIDTFLRPKIVRYMLAQKDGVDFRSCLDSKKIVLIKLSQGMIGEDNSFLLGSLFLAKFNQAAQGRQNLPKEQRHPYYVYLDEFQNFITPSITSILSGARKYGLGLILAHQELGQIDDHKILNSVLSNPYVRVCFRLGDMDAKKLENGFSYFDQDDLQNLGIGEAIIRVGTSNQDFNVKTFPLPKEKENAPEIISFITQNVRKQYASKKQDIVQLLDDLLPRRDKKAVGDKKTKSDAQFKEPVSTAFNDSDIAEENNLNKISEKNRKKLIQDHNSSREVRAHTYLQTTIKKLGQDRGFIAHSEYPTKEGGKIDVVLEKGMQRIAFEISETNKPQYEVLNIKKCLKEGCIPVVVVSRDLRHLNSIKSLSEDKLSKKDMKLIEFMQPDQVSGFLDALEEPRTGDSEVVKGFRIVTEYDSENSSHLNIKSRLTRLFRNKR